MVDVDECTYSGEDPDFQHKCFFPATCRNLQCGDDGAPSYECVCTNPKFEPDGNHGCRLKQVEVPLFSLEEKDDRVVVDSYCSRNLAEAFAKLQWCFTDLTTSQVTH